MSIGAVPKNYRLCQGNPDNHPCRAHGGVRGSGCTDDVEPGAAVLSPARGFHHRLCELSASHMMENFGPYGSSALPPYHGVMVRLCCLRCQFGMAAHPPKVRHVWGTTRGWGPHPKERGHGSFPVCSSSPPPPTRYAPWQQSLAEAPNGSRKLLVYREEVLEDLDRHAVRHKRRPLRLHEAQLRQGALGE